MSYFPRKNIQSSKRLMVTLDVHQSEMIIELLHLLQKNYHRKIKTTPQSTPQHEAKAQYTSKSFPQRTQCCAMANTMIIHTLIASAILRRWQINQMDVKNVFLRGDLKENVYVGPFYKGPLPRCQTNNANLISKLKRSTCGLNQVPCIWLT